MEITNWNPDLYLKFMHERTQPSIDLVSKIELIPNTIIDIGCGPGNSTRILRNKWNSARIVGLDISSQMIEKAKNDHPDQQWILADINAWEPDGKYDLVFSNAALQWIQDQRKIILKLFEMVNNGGVLAVQVPANSESILHKALLHAADHHKWKKYAAEMKNIIIYLPADFYYTILHKISKNIILWETIYYHIMDSHNDLIEWYKSTGMKAYLDALPDDNCREEFIDMVLNICKSGYKMQGNGKILFQFKRLFFVAHK